MTKPPPPHPALAYIFQHVQTERCVLLLGPEIGHHHHKHHLSDICDPIIQDHGRDAIEYLEDIGLFLLRENMVKLDLQMSIRTHYQKSPMPEDIYKKIIEIPFPLVLSLSPDRFLSELASRYGIYHQFKFFHHNGMAQDPIEKPSRMAPLFYNLLGSIEEEESLVIDYEDLFELLSKILGAPGIPDPIRGMLDKAKSFLFVGFDFEKWYTQLLLQLLIGKSNVGARKIAIRTDLANPKAKNFLVHQFHLQFLQDDMEFLFHLHHKFNQEGKLRKLRNLIPKYEIEVIRKMMGKDDLRAAMDYLTPHIGGTRLQSELLTISGQFEQLKTEHIQGVLETKDYLDKMNPIRRDIMNLIDQIK